MTNMPAIPAKDNAKNVRIVGFALFLVSNMLNLLLNVASLPVYFSLPYGFMNFMQNVAWFLQFAGLLVAAIGFFITFSQKQDDTLALFAGITLALAVVLYALFKFTPVSLPALLSQLLLNLFFIALAVRTLRYNQAIGIVLILAFVFRFVTGGFLTSVIFRTLAVSSLYSSVRLMHIYFAFIALADVVCAVMALLSALLEKDTSTAKPTPYSFG